jgi:hypothetical protein
LTFNARPCARPGRNQGRKKAVSTVSDDARADYIEALLAVRPSLRDVSGQTVRRVACLLYRLGTKRYEHSDGDGTISIGYAELDAVFGRRAFDQFNAVHEILLVRDAHFKYGDGGKTKKYCLHPDIQSMDERYCAKYDAITAPLVDLIRPDGKMRLTCPEAVASKDGDGNTAKLWGGTDVNRTVVVDIERLLSVRDHWLRKLLTEQLSAEESRKLGRMAKLASRLVQDAHTKVAGRGEVVTRYREVASGRLYGFGRGPHLQTVDRLVRFAAMSGMYDYDIANCHFSLFKQMAERREPGASGPRFRCKVIDSYLADKKGVRAKLAVAVGCDQEQIKECLIALIYGASSFDMDAEKERAIPVILGYNSEWVDAFKSHPWVRKLRSEIKRAGKRILKGWPRKNRGLYVNDAGKGIEATEPEHEILAHLVQGAEAVVLHAMFGAVPDPTQVALLQHDGFTSRTKLDAVALEAVVLCKTGFAISLEERAIQSEPGIERTKTTKQDSQPLSRGCGQKSAFARS